MDLARALAERLPGSRVREGERGAVLVFEVDGCWLDARIREGLGVEVFVRTLEVPGVRVAIAGRGRTLDLQLGLGSYTDDALNAAFAVIDPGFSAVDLAITVADDPVAALWVDEPARVAMVDALWVARDSGALGPGAIVESYAYVVEDGHVSFGRRAVELDQLERAFRAGAMLAARPHRLAREWLDVARGLGGTTTVDRWDLGVEFAATIDRSPATVRLDNLRRLPGGDDDFAGLYTRGRARRLAADGDRFALWAPSIERAHRPRLGRGVHPVALAGWTAEASDPARLGERIRRHGALLEAAAPSALFTDGAELTLWWPGLVLEPARLGPAVELLADLAAEMDASAGPYR